MAKGKRNRQLRKKGSEALERGLSQLSIVRAHTSDRLKKLDTKIAAQEELIKLAKEDEAAEAAEQESSDA